MDGIQTQYAPVELTEEEQNALNEMIPLPSAEPAPVQPEQPVNEEGSLWEDTKALAGGMWDTLTSEGDTFTRMGKGVVSGLVETGEDLANVLLSDSMSRRLAGWMTDSEITAITGKPVDVLEGGSMTFNPETNTFDFKAYDREELGAAGTITEGLTNIFVPGIGATMLVGRALSLGSRFGNVGRQILSNKYKGQAIGQTLGTIAEGSLGFTAASQLTFDPNAESMTKLLSSYPEIANTAVLGKTLEFLSYEKDDPEAEKRFKTFLFEAGLGTIAYGLVGAAKGAKALYKAPLKDEGFNSWLITNSKHHQTTNLIEEARDEAIAANPNLRFATMDKVDEAAAQILNSNRQRDVNNIFEGIDEIDFTALRQVESVSGNSALPRLYDEYVEELGQASAARTPTPAAATFKESLTAKAGEPEMADIPLTQRVKLWGEKAYQKLFDPQHAWYKLVKEETGLDFRPHQILKTLRKQQMNPDGPSIWENPYITGRLLTGSNARASAAIAEGMPRISAEGAKEMRVVAGNSKGLTQILDKVEKHGKLDDFTTYVVARRISYLADLDAQRLAADPDNYTSKIVDGKLAGFDIQMARQAADELGADEFILNQARELKKFTDDLLRYELDSNMIDQKTFDNLTASPVWVPLKRKTLNKTGLEVRQSKSRTTRSFSGKDEGTLADIWDTLARDTMIKITAADLNRHNRIAHKFLKDSGQIKVTPAMGGFNDAGINRLTDDLAGWIGDDIANEIVPELQKSLSSLGIRAPSPRGETRLSYIEGGKVKYYDIEGVRADLIMDSMNSNALIRPQQGAVRKTLSGIKKLQSQLITLSPRFLATIVPKDMVAAYINSPFNKLPRGQSLRGLKELYSDTDTLHMFHLNGGGFGSRYREIDQAFDVQLQNVTSGVASGSPAVRMIKRSMTAMGKPLSGYRNFAMNTELMSRIGEYMLAKKMGIDDVGAAYLAREVTSDLMMRGTSDKVRAMADVIPFFGATMAGLAKHYQVLGSRKALALIGAYAATDFSLHLINRDDPDYRNTSGYVKDHTLLFPVGDNMDEWEQWANGGMQGEMPEKTFQPIPKGFGLSWLGNSFRYMYEAIEGEESNPWKKIVAFVIKDFTPFDPETGISAGFAGDTLMGLYSGKDSFGRSLVPEHLEDAAPHLQYRKDTTELAKAISKYTDLPAGYVDFGLKSLFVGLGRDFLMGVEHMSKTESGAPRIAAQPHEAYWDLPKTFDPKENATSLERGFEAVGVVIENVIGGAFKAYHKLEDDEYNGAVSRLYETRDELRKRFSSAQDALNLNKGERSEAKQMEWFYRYYNGQFDEITEEDRQIVRLFPRLSPLFARMAYQGDRLRAVPFDTVLTPEEKAEKEKKLTIERNELATIILDTIYNMPELDYIFAEIGKMWGEGFIKQNPAHASAYYENTMKEN